MVRVSLNFFRKNKGSKDRSKSSKLIGKGSRGTSGNTPVLDIPTHIAIIPDGNRRWAAKRGVSTKMGHREGAYNFKKIVIAASKLKVKYITFYAFSTENWSRDEDEVDGLMDLMLEFLKNAEKELAGNNVCIRVIGNSEPLSEKLKNEIRRVVKSTSKNDGTVLNIAINYGSRDEILNATKKIAQDIIDKKYNVEDINFDVIDRSLYTWDCPDPDLLIRTSGEIRISNFLLWQMAYTEFWFSKTLWPEFSEGEFFDAIDAYSQRKRRFGGL